MTIDTHAPTPSDFSALHPILNSNHDLQRAPHARVLLGGFYDCAVKNRFIGYIALRNARSAYIYYVCAKYYVASPAQRQAYDTVIDRANAYSKHANTWNTAAAAYEMIHDSTTTELLCVRELPPPQPDTIDITLAQVLKIKRFLSVVHFFKFIHHIVCGDTAATCWVEFWLRVVQFHARGMQLLGACVAGVCDKYADVSYLNANTHTPNMFLYLYAWNLLHMNDTDTQDAVCADADVCAFFPNENAKLQQELMRDMDMLADVADLLQWQRAIREFEPFGQAASEVWRALCACQERVCASIPAALHERCDMIRDVIDDFLFPQTDEIVLRRDMDADDYAQHCMFYPQINIANAETFDENETHFVNVYAEMEQQMQTTNDSDCSCSCSDTDCSCRDDTYTDETDDSEDICMCCEIGCPADTCRDE